MRARRTLGNLLLHQHPNAQENARHKCALTGTARRIRQLETGIQVLPALEVKADDFEYAVLNSSIFTVYRSGQGAKEALRANP